MFLFESRTSEPKFFSIFRFFTAIVFSFALVFYAWNSFGEFVFSFDKPTLYLSSHDNSFVAVNYTYPRFKICPRTLGNYNGDDSLNISLYKLYSDFSSSKLYVPNDYSFYDYENDNKYLNEFHPYNFNQSYELYSNGSIPKNSDFFIRDYDNNRCRIFTPPFINSEFANIVNIVDSPNKFNNELLFVITLDNSSMYSYFEINFESINISTASSTMLSFSKNVKNESLNPNQYFITRGQYFIYEFNIKSISHYSLASYGILGFKADDNSMNIEIVEKLLAPTPDTSYTVLELRFNSDYYLLHQEVKYQTVNKFVSSLGGFYSAISGVFFILFGASRLSPWGICQKWLCCWSYRRSFKRKLASRYVSRAGIPLAEDPRKLPPGAELRDRVAVLEHLLKEYYIDAYFLEKLKTTRKRYLDLRNNNREIVKILGDDISDDDLMDNIALEHLEEGSIKNV
ncbi:hypothetical protein RclHR1_05360003 [Rhizophagus clarus]|uniref:Uncharacterized protein n=1 Tax=Rhizophagus clarus TaxID=94130 RepID=A0A2Z6RSM6_9GLOM|nr:hypothetical protein RclHR1_05360003 [Rhizophagus clarus]GES74953.1 hypothetical protein GLOIN_2v1841879 [Rhizophagus clarus]